MSDRIKTFEKITLINSGYDDRTNCYFNKWHCDDMFEEMVLKPSTITIDQWNVLQINLKEFVTFLAGEHVDHANVEFNKRNVRLLSSEYVVNEHPELGLTMRYGSYIDSENKLHGSAEIKLKINENLNIYKYMSNYFDSINS